MGIVTSRMVDALPSRGGGEDKGLWITVNRPRATVVLNRLRKLLRGAWWLGTNTIWLTATASIVLAVPVVFHYEKECQLFEMHAQLMHAQHAMNTPQFN